MAVSEWPSTNGGDEIVWAVPFRLASLPSTSQPKQSVNDVVRATVSDVVRISTLICPPFAFNCTDQSLHQPISDSATRATPPRHRPDPSRTIRAPLLQRRYACRVGADASAKRLCSNRGLLRPPMAVASFGHLPCSVRCSDSSQKTRSLPRQTKAPVLSARMKLPAPPGMSVAQLSRHRVPTVN